MTTQETQQLEEEGIMHALTTYEEVGAGNWTALILQTEWDDEKWEYGLAIFPTWPEEGPEHGGAFRPEDVLDLPKFVQVLAATLAEDGCMKQELRDDLACLAASMDWILGSGYRLEPSDRVVIKRKPLERILEYLWPAESEDFCAADLERRQRHIFQAVAEVKGCTEWKVKRGEDYLPSEVTTPRSSK